MKTFFIVLIIILAVVVGALIALYFVGKKMQKKQEANQASIDAAAQTMNFFIIDMKRMKLSEAGLPKIVTEQTPKYLRRAKLPILKVKVGPRVMSLICDAKVFETLAPKQEVKATVSGIYVTGAKRIRGPIVETDPKKRKAQLKAEKQAAKEAAKAAKKAGK
ncbi:MAG: hypothetical protein UF228_06940 [Lachnospiraceae bacterium]|jgi:uncharacterized protein YneF (UPF0154 family)|nr:hypothetical protein [Lachnospiraceae bacterium]